LSSSLPVTTMIAVEAATIYTSDASRRGNSNARIAGLSHGTPLSD
jgi:hypothetical protein